MNIPAILSTKYVSESIETQHLDKCLTLLKVEGSRTGNKVLKAPGFLSGLTTVMRGLPSIT